MVAMMLDVSVPALLRPSLLPRFPARLVTMNMGLPRPPFAFEVRLVLDRKSVV